MLQQGVSSDVSSTTAKHGTSSKCTQTKMGDDEEMYIPTSPTLASQKPLQSKFRPAAGEDGGSSITTTSTNLLIDMSVSTSTVQEGATFTQPAASTNARIAQNVPGSSSSTALSSSNKWHVADKTNQKTNDTAAKEKRSSSSGEKDHKDAKPHRHHRKCHHSHSEHGSSSAAGAAPTAQEKQAQDHSNAAQGTSYQKQYKREQSDQERNNLCPRSSPGKSKSAGVGEGKKRGAAATCCHDQTDLSKTQMSSSDSEACEKKGEAGKWASSTEVCPWEDE